MHRMLGTPTVTYKLYQMASYLYVDAIYHRRIHLKVKNDGVVGLTIYSFLVVFTTNNLLKGLLHYKNKPSQLEWHDLDGIFPLRIHK